ncbi:MAG TPA: hypothetical protein PKD99_12275 [Sphingopyxis sp.]|nr:hypothetical protein [Sphingopyxis sp.]HMP45875.1 hypothetical protein [Sphingopyxis sp.]HMQ17560.1 hypothetical protein [Sphingopyxis sp.]
MLTAASEFPVKSSLTRSRFIAEVIAWLRGNQSSTVLDDRSDSELDSDFSRISNSAGEILEIREIASLNEGLPSIGFRHELPDKEGRKWVTEGVLSPIVGGGKNLIRFRSQCIPNEVDAYLEIPKKPYLIKSLLRADLGDRDGEMIASDKPCLLSHERDGDYELATKMCLGRASDFLPIVYISAPLDDRDRLSLNDLEHLSDRLGGCAHVVVEPDSRFSWKIKESSGSANPYRGFVGIIAPKHGVIRRLSKGHVLPTNAHLKDAIIAIAREVTSRLPAQGMGWTDLQERALRSRRDSMSAASMEPELEELYKSELENKKLEINALYLEMSALSEKVSELSEYQNGIIASNLTFGNGLVDRAGNEIYSGEFGDRILNVLTRNINFENSREDFVVEAITKAARDSSGVVALRHSIRNAAKGGPDSLIAVLEEHGYRLKSQDRHYVLEPLSGYGGLSIITLAKTPSEYRGTENAKAQVLRALGI